MPYSEWFGKFNMRIHDDEANEKHHRPHVHVVKSDGEEIVVFLDGAYEVKGMYKNPTEVTQARKTVKKNLDELINAWYDCN